MDPGARRRPAIAGGRRGWSAGEREAVGGREHQAVGAVGVAADAESTLVVEAVVTVAETNEVPADRGASVLPVDDVVELYAPPGAAGHPTAPIPVFDQPAQCQRHGAGGAADVEWATVADADDEGIAVAQQLPAEAGGDDRTGMGTGLPCVGVDVDHGSERLAPWRALDRPQRSLGDIDEGVGPGDLGFSVVEEPIVRLPERGVDDGAIVGVEHPRSR